MKKVIAGRLYDTETATLIADNEFSDGTNRLTRGRRTALYKTVKGAYFAHLETSWQGERDSINPLTKDHAKATYEELCNQHIGWSTAFDEEVEAA